MKKEDVYFARSLVKGKIAETIFAQMLRSTGEFTVLEFGYEKIIPELIGQRGNKSEILETLRTAPDFAIINKKTKRVYLIEVKYRRHINPQEVLETSKRMHQSWNPSYIFIANDNGFYFGETRDIIERKGHIQLLEHPQIPKDTQAKFLQILKDFEADN